MPEITDVKQILFIGLYSELTDNMHKAADWIEHQSNIGTIIEDITYCDSDWIGLTIYYIPSPWAHK